MWDKQIRIAVILICSMLAVSTVAAERGVPSLNWDRDVRDAWQSAVQVDRPLLVFITMDGCVYCEKMKKLTLQDRLVVQELRSEFVPVALNVKEAPDLVERLQVKSFPTTVVIHTNGDVLESISGYQSSKQLRDRLHATLRLVAQERAAVRRR